MEKWQLARFADACLGAIVSLSIPEEGSNVWEANQVELVCNLPPGNIQERK